ncbi:MAG TPA: pentapeptide repeat-containing protein [Methanothrix sp.]|nr:pentapeptide repeat-containing protein [Methanothrix sp.]
MAQFSGDASFSSDRFSGNASFSSDRFSGNAYFTDAQFSGNVIFSDAQFSGNADFRGAQFDKELNLDNLKLDRLYINWSSIRDNLVYDGPAYLALIKNFEVIERFSDADDCYYQYREESRALKEWYSEKSGWDRSKLLDTIAWITCGYGVRPIHTVFCMFGVVFVSGIIFLGYFDSLFESFYFSLMTFTGGNPNNLEPGRWLRSLSMIEAILGYLFMALFVVVLARKLIR